MSKTGGTTTSRTSKSRTKGTSRPAAPKSARADSPIIAAGEARPAKRRPSPERGMVASPAKKTAARHVGTASAVRRARHDAPALRKTGPTTIVNDKKIMPKTTANDKKVAPVAKKKHPVVTPPPGKSHGRRKNRAKPQVAARQRVTMIEPTPARRKRGEDRGDGRTSPGAHVPQSRRRLALRTS
jgi:hypothetical protein